MDDLISRAAAIKGLLSLCPKKTEPGSFDEYGVTVLCGAVDVVIKGLPAVDAAPVVHGRWQGVSPMVDSMECSVCRYCIPSEEFETPFCSWCGAKMDGERRDSE